MCNVMLEHMNVTGSNCATFAFSLYSCLYGTQSVYNRYVMVHSVNVCVTYGHMHCMQC